MSSQSIDSNTPSIQGPPPKTLQELPRGLLTPPEKVRESVAQEKAKALPRILRPEVEEWLLNEWTLQYHFNSLGYEVLYRPTAQGPEVLAVGFEEIFARTKGMDPDEMKGLKTWMPG
jgi:hypothetical protein